MLLQCWLYRRVMWRVQWWILWAVEWRQSSGLQTWVKLLWHHSLLIRLEKLFDRRVLRMMPGLQMYHRSCVTLSFNLLTPKVNHFMPLGVSFTFLLCEMLREIYGKVKDDFLAEASLPWHPVNGNVYKQTFGMSVTFSSTKIKIKLQYHSYQYWICTETLKFQSPLMPRCGRS